MRKIVVSFPERYIERLQKLVEAGMYISRGDAIRFAVKDLIEEEVGFGPPPLVIEEVKRSELAKRANRL